jgi:hypothetical protein
VTDYKPRSELTQEEAIESITRRELREVKEKFGVALIQDFADESKLEECMWALCWLFERRADPGFTDDQLDDFALGAVMNYFRRKQFEGDESAAGKGPGSAPSNSPNGASSPASLPASMTI